MNGVARMTRRLDSGFRQKFENFLSFQFLAKSACKIKCVRQYSGKEKKASLDYKKQKVKKSRRLRIFLKGLVHGFGQKFEIFPCFYY